MAEEESNPGTQRTAVAATRFGPFQLQICQCRLVSSFRAACAGMIVFLLLLWAAIGHRITARYHCSSVDTHQPHP